MKNHIRGNKFNFRCLNEKCTKNCCGPTFSNAEGMIKASPLLSVPKNTVPLSQKEAKFIIKKFGEDRIIKIENGGYHIKHTKENACCFFDDKNNQCSIYKNRFNSCMSYPFFFDKYWGLCIDTSCPGVGTGWSDLKEIEKKINALIKVHKSNFKEAKELFKN